MSYLTAAILQESYGAGDITGVMLNDNVTEARLGTQSYFDYGVFFPETGSGREAPFFN